MTYKHLFSYSGLTALATYFFTKEVWSKGAGLFAACFIAIGLYTTGHFYFGSKLDERFNYDFIYDKVL